MFRVYFKYILMDTYKCYSSDFASHHHHCHRLISLLYSVTCDDTCEHWLDLLYFRPQPLCWSISGPLPIPIHRTTIIYIYNGYYPCIYIFTVSCVRTLYSNVIWKRLLTRLSFLAFFRDRWRLEPIDHQHGRVGNGRVAVSAELCRAPASPLGHVWNSGWSEHSAGRH